MEITWQDFEKIDIRVGTVVEVSDFPEARNPAFKRSSAQITGLYKKEDLAGKQVIAVVNFPPKQVANFISECLVLGVMGDRKEVILLHPERPVANGLKIG
jgi:tRNA-binding protein